MSNSERANCLAQFKYNNQSNYIIALLTNIIHAVCMTGIAFVLMWILDAVIETDSSAMLRACIISLIFFIVFAAVSYIQKFFRNRYLQKALFQFKNYIFDKILNKSISDFAENTSGKLINAFSNDLSAIETNYLNGTLELMNQIVLFIIALIAMFFLNVPLTLCVIAACLIPVLIALRFGSRLTGKEIDTSNENESFVSQVKDLISGFLVLKSFKAEKEVLQIFKNKNISLEDSKKDKRNTTNEMTVASELSSFLVVGIILVFGAYLTFKNIISVATIIAFVQLSNYLLGPITTVVPLWSNRQASLALIDKVAEAINDADTVVQDQKQIIGAFEDSITFKNVSYFYDDQKEALHHINLTLEKGKSYAIVGGSGSGKSTLTKLIMGYFKDYLGDVKIDETELKDIDLDSLYNLVSLCQQEVFLFDTSIINNITMFKEFSESEIERVLTLSGLKALVTEKGRAYSCGENGCNLSGGEKQRISIARSLIRKTPVLIMDESTAALDNITAYEVTSAVLKIDGITRLVVTHKLDEQLLRMFDEIIVMRDGKLVEQGHFDYLLRQKEYFYSMFYVEGFTLNEAQPAII